MGISARTAAQQNKFREANTMTIVKLVKWTSAAGKNVEAKIEVTRKMNDNIAYADGYNINLGKEAYESLKITVSVDGEYFADSMCEPSVVDERYYGKEFMFNFKKSGAYALIGSKVGVRKDVYENIMATIAEATTEASQDEEYAAHIEAKKATEEAARPAKEAAAKELRETEIPATAVSAYNHYHGNAEVAWAKEDETSWALIEKWAPYIEAQHGMDTEKIKCIATEAAREASFGIND
jgi:hypothetical protein